MAAKKLKKLRLSRNLRQLRLATYLRIPTKQYQRYELGLSDLPESVLTKLAEFFDVPVEYFLND